MKVSQPQFDKIEGIIKRTILNEIISASQAANMSESFIKNIKLKKVSNGTYEIENEWRGENDEPLAFYHEYGTIDHWIEPKTADGTLAWSSGGPNSGGATAIYSKRADNKKGSGLFSAGHYVSGLPALEPMTNGFKIGIQKMKAVLENG